MPGKSYKRRHFLRTLVLLGSFLPTRLLLAVPVEKQRQLDSLAALTPFLNTLIPEDISPSAGQLNVGPQLIAKARQTAGFERLMILGCSWLDEQSQKLAQRNFEHLEKAFRIAIVTTAEQSAERSLPRVFFNAIRHYAFEIYYAQPVTWSSLGYNGPPQPIGFPDYAKPPGSTRA